METKPQLRRNAVTGQCVVIAPSRSKRPFGVTPTPSPQLPSPAASPPPITVVTAPTPLPLDPHCPFCPGNEERELEVVAWPSQQPWRVRIVRNRFPALFPPPSAADTAVETGGVAHGFHEVVVITPTHGGATALMRGTEVADALRVVHERVIAVAERCACVAVFENHGALAGSSLPHPHWQILALARGCPLPPKLSAMLARAAETTTTTAKTCLICTELSAELDQQARVVLESQHFVAWVPYAAETPFQMWVVPRRHCSGFAFATDAELCDLGSMLARLLLAIRDRLHDPDYNFAIVDPPLHQSPELRERLHWHVVIDVRLTQPAGFELCTGMAINPQLPELSASILRTALQKQMLSMA